MRRKEEKQQKNGRKTKMLVAIILCIVFLFLGLGACGVMKMRQNAKEAMTKITDFHTKLLGENVYIFSPEDDVKLVQETLDNLYRKQEANQFGKERYGVYFLPGEYDESLEVNVGFYMQVAGLGALPTDTKLPKLTCLARWLSDDPANHNACCNFWRSVENIELMSNTVWAVSQATDMRRVQVDGALYLHDDYGWCSGGFLSDSKIETMIDSGSQQQWLSRNNAYKLWMNDNWNEVFLGDEVEIPTQGTWPVKAYTTIESAPDVREKPYLAYDSEKGFGVYVPQIRKNATGVSWAEGNIDTWMPMDSFYVANPTVDTESTINEALAAGKNIFFTPGIYELEDSIEVKNENAILLGCGLASLKSVSGNPCIVTEDASGIILAGLLFDAGSIESENLLVVGSEDTKGDTSKETQICLSDLYFRVGGTPTAEPAKTKCCVTIHSDDVIGDNFWVWRADHGDQVAWDLNTCDNGIVIHGNRVHMYALMVEHFEKYQTLWDGNEGILYMYQSEIPYDVPKQEQWMSHEGKVNGYASIYVDDKVDRFEAQAIGIYLYNRDAAVALNSAMELPDAKDVRVHNICTVMLTGFPGMEHIINDAGEAVLYAGQRQIIRDYCNGEWK